MKKLTILLALALLASPSIAEETSDAEKILDAMMEGNMRFVAGESTFPNLTADRRAETTTGGQHPYATVIACSDSRVPVEAIFDAGIGEIFVIRVAGNVCQTDEIGSIEYGVEHLGTPVMLVLGHEHCGAVTAVLTGAEVHGSIPRLVAPIAPVAEMIKEKHGEEDQAKQVSAAVAANVMHQMKLLLKGSPGVAERVKHGKTVVIGGVYDLATGEVKILGAHPDQDTILEEVGIGHSEGH